MTPPSTIAPDAVMRPDSFYGLSKCCGELLAGLNFERFGIRSLNIRIGNATMTPSDARSHAIWISPRDLAQMVPIGLEHPDIDCTTVFGVSRTAQTWWNNSVAEALGYHPEDSSGDTAEPVAPLPNPSPLSHIAEHFQGGRYCILEHDGQLRIRRTV